MRFTTKCEYGIVCLLHLAKSKSDSPISLSELSKHENIQKDYVEKIMLALKGAGFVRALRGLNGGFLLAKSPDEINMMEVVVALEGKTFETFCEPSIRERITCLYFNRRCELKPLWEQVQQSVDQVLSNVTLEDIINGKLMEQSLSLAEAPVKESEKCHE